MVLHDYTSLLNKVTQVKSPDRQIVYNLVLKERTKFGLSRIFVLIIVNFILLWIFPLSYILGNLINPVSNEHPRGSDPGGPSRNRYGPNSSTITGAAKT